MSTYHPSRPRRRLLSFLLFATLLVSLAMPALAQEGAPPDQVGAGQPASCAPLNEAEQQEFDSLTAMKAADALAGADLARYDALAQQINCYNAQFAAPPQPQGPVGALREVPYRHQDRWHHGRRLCHSQAGLRCHQRWHADRRYSTRRD